MSRFVLFGCVAALVLAGAASARIVPQQGIAGAALGMTKAKVRAKLGAPRSVKHGSNEFGPYTVFRYPEVIVTFQGNANVTAVSTTSARQRTASGVGVGSTESQVRRGVPGVRCRSTGRFRHCTLGRELPGQRVTDFFIVRGRVARLLVGFVID